MRLNAAATAVALLMQKKSKATQTKAQQSKLQLQRLRPQHATRGEQRQRHAVDKCCGV